MMLRALICVIALFMISCMVTQNQAQVQEQDCMNELRPCLYYLKGESRPSDSCCQHLDYVIKSMPECLCSLMSIPGANQAQRAGINVTEAQTLPARCGQHINPLGCVVGTPDTRSGNTIKSSGCSTFWSSSLSLAIMGVVILLIIHPL